LKERRAAKKQKSDFQNAHRPGPPVRCALFSVETGFAEWNFRRLAGLSAHTGGPGMLVERGLRVMNVEVVGDAYAIASNYLRRSGLIPDNFATNERLLQIIVELFQRGEFNRIKLANKAISRFEADELV
jgi:hypothetical protein